MLILDEATSHLDADREQAVVAAIANLGITRIIIAHAGKRSWQPAGSWLPRGQPHRHQRSLRARTGTRQRRLEKHLIAIVLRIADMFGDDAPFFAAAKISSLPRQMKRRLPMLRQR